MSDLLEPFLKAIGSVGSKEVRDRIMENIFHPLLENNKTSTDTSDDEAAAAAELAKQEHYHRHVDGGKLPPKTVVEIQKMLDTKYVFSAFNILIYAQNHILKMASSTNKMIKEENREFLYQLYDFALELEQPPEREQLTYSQQMLVNRARGFVTMKMKRRQQLRESKQETKGMIKMRRSMGDSLNEQQA